MRVKKLIKGDAYYFYLQFIPNECKAKVKYFHTDEWIICNLSNDFKYILLPINKFNFNGVNIKKLKLNKFQVLDAIDYNSVKR